MASKLKAIILSIAAIYVVCSCVKEANYYRDNITYPGYVAMEYTGNVISSYSSILTTIFQFDEYISQTTVEKRDSIDRLYFENIKILREENDNTWTLHGIYSSNGYDYILINTNGKNLNDDNAKWIVTFYNRGHLTLTNTPEFEIEKTGDQRWNIKNHINHNHEFGYSSEWNIKLNPSGGISLEGSGSMLSNESPKLKLDYTITAPIEVLYKDHFTSIPSGIITILATDVDKGITEETIVEIITSDEMKITYKNYVEDYIYSL